jgi:glucan phosphoethanolaminetransferase (alkaline phosphatase superfamily)
MKEVKSMPFVSPNSQTVSALKHITLNIPKRTRILLLVWGLFTIFDLFIVRDGAWVRENVFSERFIVNYAASSLAFFALLVLMASHLIRGRKKTILAFFILFLPLLVQISYFSVYRKFVSSFGFRAFFEDPGMIFSLWLANVPFRWIILAFVLVVFSIVLLKRVGQGFHRVTQAVSGFFILTVTALMVFSWYSVPVFQNSVMAYAGSYLELAKQKSYEQFLLNRPAISAPATEKKRPNIIFIIGESTVMSNMSLFGYTRDTTPGLKRLEQEGEIAPFDNCISIGLQTRLSVPYMMAGLMGIDPKGYIYTCPTVLNYAKARGYHTAFFTAQDLYWGRMKEILIDKDVDEFLNGTYFNPQASVHKGANDLDLLDKGIMPFLERTKTPYFLTIQMDGSHYPFSEHCEAQYKKFFPEDDPNGVNAFDNTVIYTDIFLTRLIDHVRRTDPSAWIFFSPDHGQNLGGKNGFFNDNFSSRVIHNPLIVSAPEDKMPLLRQKRKAPLSQADIVPTILDLMDLEPVKSLDGYSLLGLIPEDRLRVCSTYMPTFHNVPESVLVFNDLSYYYIDQARGSVLLSDGKTMIPFADLKPRYKKIFTRRM